MCLGYVDSRLPSKKFLLSGNLAVFILAILVSLSYNIYQNSQISYFYN